MVTSIVGFLTACIACMCAWMQFIVDLCLFIIQRVLVYSEVVGIGVISLCVSQVVDVVALTS